jgi:hypothetical protein
VLLEILSEVHRMPVKVKDSAMLSQINIMELHYMLALSLFCISEDPVFVIKLLGQRVILPEAFISVVPLIVCLVLSHSDWPY